MKTVSKFTLQISWLAFFIVMSCQKDVIFDPTMTAASTKAQAEMTAHDNSQMIAIAQDAMDATGFALGGNGISNGRYSANQRSGDHDPSLMNCAPSISCTFSIDRTHADSIIYSGTLTIDYGTGSLCKDSTEVRKGKLIDAFKLVIGLRNRGNYNLMEAVTFQGFQKDSVQVDGVFTSQSTSDTLSILTIQNAKLTYSNGTFASWNGTLTNRYILAGTFHERNSESRQVTGSISGINRQGTSFSVTIAKAILYQYSCSRNIPVAGTIDLTVGAIVSTIDFGTGSCDKEYTITTGGTTTTYTFKRHHHA